MAVDKRGPCRIAIARARRAGIIRPAVAQAPLAAAKCAGSYQHTPPGPVAMPGGFTAAYLF